MGVLDQLKGVDTVLGLGLKVIALFAGLGISGALVVNWVSGGATGFIGLTALILILIGIILAQKWRAQLAIVLLAVSVVCGILAVIMIFQTKSPAIGEPPSEGIVSTPLIKGPRLDWDASGRLSLQGRYTRQGGPISVYVTYESLGSMLTRRTNMVLAGPGGIEPRIKVDSLSHFDEDEMADLTLGFVIDDNGKILQWGQPQQNKTKIGITFASYFGNVILVSSDGKTVESYPFAIISTSDQQVTGANASPPIMISPDVLIAQQHRK